MNIVLVVFDSLRKDAIGIYGKPPWGPVHTPHLDAFARESVVFTRAYPESLPTLPARRALYTGQRTYPFRNDDWYLKGDFHGAPGWGPIPEHQSTLAEMLREAGYRTALIADLYHMFKPSKNFWRGFDQWTFLRGQEADAYRSGPHLPREELERWLAPEIWNPGAAAFIQQCVMNMHERTKEQDYFAPRVFQEAAVWLQQNTDADRFFLTIESFDPHEPWMVPPHYRRMYLPEEGQEQVLSIYASTANLPPGLLRRAQANYSGLVTMCDRWFGYFIEQMRVMGLLDDTLVVVTSDHGHSIGDGGYMGKRGYPSHPSVYDIPLIVRFPKARHAGKRSEAFVQPTDVAASILKAAGVKPPQPIEGRDFLADAAAGRPGRRDHVTVAWGSTVTVITRRWWLNCKVDGKGVLLHDLRRRNPFARNVAAEHPRVVSELFDLAVADAGGGFPEWILELARSEADAPGCSDLAARKPARSGRGGSRRSR